MPQAILVLDGAQELSLVLEHRTHVRIVDEAGVDGRAEDEPGALEFTEIAVGTADDEDLLVGNFEFRKTLSEHLESLDAAPRVIMLGATVDPEQHACDVTFVVAPIAGEEVAQIPQPLTEAAVVEMKTTELESFGVVQLIDFGALGVGAENRQLGALAELVGGGIGDVADDRRADAIVAGRTSDEVVVNVAHPRARRHEHDDPARQHEMVPVRSTKRALDEHHSRGERFFDDQVSSGGAIVQIDGHRDALPHLDLAHRRRARHADLAAAILERCMTIGSATNGRAFPVLLRVADLGRESAQSGGEEVLPPPFESQLDPVASRPDQLRRYLEPQK